MAGILDALFGGQPQQPPQQQQPQLPISLQQPLGGRVGAGMMGFLNAGSLPQALGNLVGGLASGQRLDPQGIQQQILTDQYQDWIKKNPGGDINKFLYDISGPGLQQQYGPPTPVPGYEFGPYKSPGFIMHGQPQAPPGFPGGNAQPGAGIQGQPSQQPQGGQAAALPPVAQSVLEYERQLEAAKAKGGIQGEAEVTTPAATDQIDRSLALIDDIAKDPGMKWATGKLAAIPPIPGTAPYGFTKKVDQLKDQLTLDLLPSLQRGKNTRISPALIDLLSKSTAGQELDRANPDFPNSLQNTRKALVQIRGALQSQANLPVTAAPSEYEGRTVTNNKTGQRGVIKNGQLVPMSGPQ